MAIDFSLVGGDKEGTVSLSHEVYIEVSSVFEEFMRRTGVYVDPYSDTKISPAHAAIILSLLSDCPEQFGEEIACLIDLLSKANERALWVRVTGD